MLTLTVSRTRFLLSFAAPPKRRCRLGVAKISGHPDKHAPRPVLRTVVAEHRKLQTEVARHRKKLLQKRKRIDALREQSVQPEPEPEQQQQQQPQQLTMR